MHTLHLFAGIGGGILADELLGHTPVGAVEIDPYCREILRLRWPHLEIHDDIRTFDATPWRGRVDCVAGGFPCQPWSVAGKRLGAADPRHLWPEMARVIEQCRPRFVFAENVQLDAFREPHRDLRAMGYRVPPALRLGAEDLGAPHRRWRWWLLAAHPDADGWRREGLGLSQPGGQQGSRGRQPDGLGQVREQHDGAAANSDRGALRQQPGRSEPGRAGANEPGQHGGTGPLAEPRSPGLEVAEQEALPRTRRRHEGRAAAQRGWWAAEPDVGRVAHGVPSRTHRLKALGNAQVPAVAAAAFRALMARMEQ